MFGNWGLLKYSNVWCRLETDAHISVRSFIMSGSRLDVIYLEDAWPIRNHTMTPNCYFVSNNDLCVLGKERSVRLMRCPIIRDCIKSLEPLGNALVLRCMCWSHIRER